LFSFDTLAQNDIPQEMIRKFVQIIDVAKDKSLSEFQKKQKIINIIDKSTDSKWIARFVLGKNHKTASEEQKNNLHQCIVNS
jgi:ABC-type transporter MlaC component